MNNISTYLPKLTEAQREKIQQRLDKLWQDTYIVEFMTQHQLTKEQMMQSLSQLLAFQEERDYFLKHGTSKQLPGYEPCLELVAGQLTMNYRQTQADFIKQQQKIEAQCVHYISIPKSVRHASFDQLLIEDDDVSKMMIIQKLVQFVKEMKAHPTAFHRGLYIYGSLGIGKTYLMGALANELAHDHIQTTMVNMATFISDLKRSLSQKDTTMSKKLEDIKTAQVLILDDIGMEAMSEWVRDDILGVILQYRMQEEKPTFFTSNLSMQALERHLADTKQANNTLRAQRLMSRIHYLADEMLMDGRSLR